MKNKIAIIALCLPMVGCYPGWQNVKIEDSVFKKPCEQKAASEECKTPICIDWFKKRATKYDANTVVVDYFESGKITGTYFYCNAGIKPFVAKSDEIEIVRNKFNQLSTYLDYEKAVAECKYESHKATVDTSRKTQLKVYETNPNVLDILTEDFSKSDARRIDRANNAEHESGLKIDKVNLYRECLVAKGFVFIKTTNKQDFLARDKNCPDVDVKIPCFIPADFK